MTHKPLLLVGGYGVTGQRISRLFRRRNPGWPLVIGGRSREKAAALAGELGHAEGVAVDLAARDLGLGDAAFAALGLIAYDATQRTVGFAARRAIPYLSLSGAAFEFAVDAIPGLAAARATPVVNAANWFGGAVSLFAIALAARFETVDTIEIGILVDRGLDQTGSGPATAADFQRVKVNCDSTLLREAGRYLWVPASESAGRFRRDDGVEVEGVGAVSGDVLSIGAATEAPNIRILEAWGMSSSRAAGGGACDEVNIRMGGRARDGGPMEIRQVFSCPRDKSSFTAISAVFLLERLCADRPAPGYHMAEHIADPAGFVQNMLAEGVTTHGDAI